MVNLQSHTYPWRALKTNTMRKEKRARTRGSRVATLARLEKEIIEVYLPPLVLMTGGESSRAQRQRSKGERFSNRGNSWYTYAKDRPRDAQRS